MTKNLKVTVDGKVYAVTVETPEEGPIGGLPPALAPVAPLTASAPVAAPIIAFAPAQLAAPASAEAKPGLEVTEGQRVMTLEAMKMNTYVYAPKAGKVSTVLVNAGDAVEEGAVLMVIA
jgi:biotin carboxyl carrier protein